MGKGPSPGPGGHRAKPKGGGNEGSGFCAVDFNEFLQGDALFFGVEVEHLTGNQSEAAGGMGQFGDVIGRGVTAIGLGAGDRGKGLGEEPVPGQDGHRFAVDLVTSGASAAKIIVVHAGQVVVDQGVGVNAFDRTGGRQGSGFGSPGGPGGGQAEDGAKALPPGEETITHGLVNQGRVGVLGNQAIQGFFDHG